MRFEYNTSAGQSSEVRSELVHISEGIAEFFSESECEIQAELEDLGGMEGIVLPPQQPWSHTLDQLEEMRQEALE